MKEERCPYCKRKMPSEKDRKVHFLRDGKPLWFGCRYGDTICGTEGHIKPTTTMYPEEVTCEICKSKLLEAPAILARDINLLKALYNGDTVQQIAKRKDVTAPRISNYIRTRVARLSTMFGGYKQLKLILAHPVGIEEITADHIDINLLKKHIKELKWFIDHLDKHTSTGGRMLIKNSL